MKSPKILMIQDDLRFISSFNLDMMDLKVLCCFKLVLLFSWDFYFFLAFFQKSPTFPVVLLSNVEFTNDSTFL